jgi:hypothetical protein
VLAGARAVALERYRRLVRDPERRELRSRLGLAPDPLAVLISGHLNLTSDIPLLQDEHSRVVIATDPANSCTAAGPGSSTCAKRGML